MYKLIIIILLTTSNTTGGVSSQIKSINFNSLESCQQASTKINNLSLDNTNKNFFDRELWVKYRINSFCIEDKEDN